MSYVFPRIKFTFNSDVKKGFKKIEEEVNELACEVDRYDLDAIEEELFDVIHACESMLRIMDVSDSRYDCLAAKVIIKNFLRGYYG